MCDTLVALGNATLDGSVLFAKNSDREANEAHLIELIPAADHDSDEKLQCTYISIPQVPHTHAVLLAKPFWIWGAEMGANEHGVVIGNEAVFTKVPYNKSPSLIGMDLLRLGLERATTAEEAMMQIADLIKAYGQGGDCGFAHHFYYHNSFLIADSQSAWLLETAGEHWAAQKVKDVRSISNALTIENDWDVASENLIPYAVEKGWCKSTQDFSFARCYSDFIYTRFSDARSRQSCTFNSLKNSKGKITSKMMMDLLKAHQKGEDFDPSKGVFGADVCMHAGPGPIRNSQTVGSMISQIKNGGDAIHWLTGTSAPCLSIFKPVWMDAGLPAFGPSPTGKFNRETMFWNHEILHREVLQNYPERYAVIRDEIIALQNAMFDSVEMMDEFSAEIRYNYSMECFEKSHEADIAWEKLVISMPVSKVTSALYKHAWNRLNKRAGLKLL